MSKVLCISDLHIPFEHKKAFEFINYVNEKYECDEVVIMGDLFDVYSLSKYTKSPDSYKVTDEFKISQEKIQKWIKLFPKAKCVWGNHESRINKRLSEAGIPTSIIKNFNEIYGLPDTWKWANEFIIDGVHYLHGNRDGRYAHVNIAIEMMSSVVTGHTHTSGGLHYMANYEKNIFALNVGCLIDQKTYAFAYSGEQTRRAVLGTGVVLHRLPHFIPLTRG